MQRGTCSAAAYRDFWTPRLLDFVTLDSAALGLFERENSEKIKYVNESWLFVCQTSDRPTALRSPPLLLRKGRKVRDEDVAEDVKQEYAA